MVRAALTLALTLTPVLALTLLLTPLSAAPAGQSGDSDEPLDRTDRVVGGTEVPPGEGGGVGWGRRCRTGRTASWMAQMSHQVRAAA